MSAKSFLAVDFGANTLKAAEFDITPDGSLALRNYGFRALGLAGSQESAREGLITKALQALAADRGFASKQLNVCAPGFNVFSKFVKLPPVDSSKITQIIQYEAQQNVPFPLEEVVWDYQIMGKAAGGELEVLLVAIKSDIVEGLFRTADGAGMKLQLVDVSPAALANAFRFNYPELEGCTMLLDIGAKTSNLLFFEGDKVYARSITIGANAITQEFAAESKMPFAKAEELKINEGFVSLGGAYEEPDNAHQAAISKIARQVMTRLHIQVNQTIQFYRQQQGGSVPVRMFLSGGASIMPYTAQFFSEKLNVPVEYFNPLRNVQLDETLDLEDLAKVAHSLGEVVGVALRNLAQCPVELNLMPKSLLQRQQVSQKRPYFIAAALSLILGLGGFGLLYAKLADLKADALAEIKAKADPLEARDRALRRVLSETEAKQEKLAKMSDWVEDRVQYLELFNELQRVLLEAETRATRELGVPTGIWIEKLVTVHPLLNDQMKKKNKKESAAFDITTMSQDYIDRYGDLFKDQLAPKKGESAELVLDDINDTNAISTVAMVVRAVDVEEESGNVGANNMVSYGLLEMLKESPLIQEEGTVLDGGWKKDPSTDTITFPLNLKLKRPIKL